MRNRFPILLYVTLWLASAASLCAGVELVALMAENRTLAAAPDLALARTAPRKFAQQTTAYIADHFGLRVSALWLHHRLKYDGLGTSPNPDALLGREGWLLWAGQNNLPFVRNALPYPQEEYVRTLQNWYDSERWLAKRGIAFSIVIPPEPVTVFPHLLPAGITRIAGPTRRELLMAEANRFLRLPILDLVPLLQEQQKVLPTYYPTSSHWSVWGAYLTTQLLMQQYHAAIPKIPALKMSREARIEWMPPEPVSAADQPLLYDDLGTVNEMARLIGMTERFASRPLQLVIPHAQARYEKRDVRNVHEYTTHCAQCPNVKLLMVLDSFGNPMEPILSSHFREVVYVWNNTLPFDRIAAEKPDLVLFEFVERKLTGLPPSTVPVE